MNAELSLTSPCCKKPEVTNMDHRMYANAEGHLFFWNVQDFDTPTQITNRCCTKCGMHWYGRDGDIKQFTAKEWQERMNAC